jgi:hypothetical protein
VFDAKIGSMYDNLITSAVVARRCGYRFIAFNGDIFFISDDLGTVIETGLTVEDMRA